MIKVVAKSTVKADKINQYIEQAGKLVEATKKEAGCIKYELCQDIKNPQVLTIIEEWQDSTYLDSHMNSPHFKEIFPLLGEFLEAQTELNIYKILF